MVDSTQSEIATANGGTIEQGGTINTEQSYASVSGASQHLGGSFGGTIDAEQDLTVVAQADVTDGNAEIARIDHNTFEIGLQVGPMDMVEIHGRPAPEAEDVDQSL